MKKTIILLLMVIMTAFGSFLGRADSIIYSNDFTLGSAVNIYSNAPTVANTYAGGISNAVWIDIDGTNNTHGPLLANGIDTCTQIDYWALPFTPQTNFVYLLTVNLTFYGDPGFASEIGFSQNFTTNYTLDARLNGNAAGYDWMAVAAGSQNVQYFTGPKANQPAIFSANSVFSTNLPTTNTVQILLSTKNALWTIAGYVNGVQMGTGFTYAANPSPNLLSVGLSQNGALSAPTNIQYNTFALTTTVMPFIVTQPPLTQTVGGGTAYTNTVTVVADTNGGPLVYQWYANGLPLANGVSNVLSGANSSNLVINPIATINQFTNYYVTVSNNFGSATSTFSSVTVLTNPAVTAPSSLSNAITLFTSSGTNIGSSPTFSVTAIGAPPLFYRWLTNGVTVAGATNNSISFTNLSAGSPTTYTCIVSNSFGPTNVNWFASYVTTPTAAYPQAVLGDFPLELWRLNEADDGLNDTNNGVIAHDYQSGNNGIYNNVALGQTGYDSLETSEISMAVTANATPSCANAIGNLDLAATMTNGVNAQFSVEAWANCLAANGPTGGAPVVAQGAFGTSSFFLGVDTNSPKHYQFYVRNAAGTLVSADDTVISAQDLNWHYLVGVCDEAHSNVTLYIDGRQAASASIAANSGNFESGYPISIGAGIRTNVQTTNVPFTGNIDDVAIYKRALSIGQVINHYAAVGGTVPISLVAPLPPTNLPYLANQTLTISATIAGSGPLSYYWTNLTTGGPALSSGSTPASGSLDATLTIPNASSNLSGDQLELVASNPSSSTNATVTLFNPPAPVTLDYTNPILYTNIFNGGTWTQMGRPASAANFLVGGTNSLWVDELGTNDTTGTMTASGVATSTQSDAWVLPFIPHVGYVYTINGSVTFTGSPANWVGIGFGQKILTNGTDGRFNGGAPGIDWMILTEATSNVQYFAGPSGGGGTILSANNSFTPNLGTHAIRVVLDTTATQWKASGFVDNIQMGSTFTYTVANTPTNITAIGIAQNSAINPVFYQWNSFALSQVASGNVPPYLLSPLPPTNSIVLSNGTVAISATAFGSGPLGYYWTNNGTVVASGTTNIMAPLPANLSVPNTSLTAGQLQLVVTNAFGTNITAITLVNPVNQNPGRLLASVSNNQLTLSWPTNLGWTLQTQTNSLGKGITTNWVTVSNSTTTNQLIVPVNQTNGSVFYRLKL